VANRTRLRLYQALLARPDRNVSAVAKQLNLSVSLASQSLRALQVHGLLEVRRHGKWVFYRPADTGTLALALRRTFQQHLDPVPHVFRLATAFTHPRRVEVVRALGGGPLDAVRLCARTVCSDLALARHLRKLEARGFVKADGKQYRALSQTSPLAVALQQWALE
jgi:DNA-binding transcriptional ArsR family regulator